MKDLTQKEWDKVFELEDVMLDTLQDHDLENLAKNFIKDKKIAITLRKMLIELSKCQNKVMNIISKLDDIKKIPSKKKKSVKKKN